MTKVWDIGGVKLSGAWAPDRIEYTHGRVHKDIQILDRTAYIIDSGVQIPEVRLQGWIYPTQGMTETDAENTLSSLNSLVIDKISCVCDFPNNVPTYIQGTPSTSAAFAVAEWSFEEEGGAPSHYRWEMNLKRVDTLDMIPVSF